MFLEHDGLEEWINHLDIKNIELGFNENSHI